MSKKRKLSPSTKTPTKCDTPLSSLIRHSISILTAHPDLQADTFAPLLHSLNEAYQLALTTEGGLFKPVNRVEDWNWQLSAEKVASITPEEQEIWKEVVGCRKLLDEWGIQVNPAAWHDALMDLRQWEAHIPGLENTPWEGGVYTISIIFGDQSNAFPKCTKIIFIHLEYVTLTRKIGTWGMTDLESMESTHIINRIPSQNGGRRIWGYSWVDNTSADLLRFAKLLRMVQKGLNRPNVCDPAQSDAYTLYKNDPAKYEQTIRKQAEE